MEPMAPNFNVAAKVKKWEVVGCFWCLNSDIEIDIDIVASCLANFEPKPPYSERWHDCANSYRCFVSLSNRWLGHFGDRSNNYLVHDSSIQLKKTKARVMLRTQNIWQYFSHISWVCELLLVFAGVISLF